jgi:hypothetical protein
MAGADGRGGLTSPRAHGALLAGGPARRGRDARARPAPLAAAPPRATDVRPPAPPAYRQTCAPTPGPRRRARRDARRSGVPTDPGCAMLQAQPDRLRVESSTDAFVCASWEVRVLAVRRTWFWAKAVTRVVPRDRPSDCPVVRMVSVEVRGFTWRRLEIPARPALFVRRPISRGAKHSTLFSVGAVPAFTGELGLRNGVRGSESVDETSVVGEDEVRGVLAGRARGGEPVDDVAMGAVHHGKVHRGAETSTT